MRRVISFAFACFLILSQGACSSMYYDAMEELGYHKRDLLIKRVKAASDAQVETKEQIISASEEFARLIGHSGSLQEQYNKAKNAYERSQARSEALEDRVEAVRSVGEALFDEWEDELDDYENRDLRRSSERAMKSSKRQFDSLTRAFDATLQRIPPVLEAFEDQVLFLKHNLNAQMVGSLREENVKLRAEVDSLVRDIEASVREAQRFVKEF